MDFNGKGGNTGEFLIKNINDPKSTTGAHEYGHSLGLDHPADTDLRGKGEPGIMYPRGTLVDAKYTYNPEKGSSSVNPKTGVRSNTLNPIYRKVTQKDIDKLGLDKLNYDPKTGTAKLGALTNEKH